MLLLARVLHISIILWTFQYYNNIIMLQLCLVVCSLELVQALFAASHSLRSEQQQSVATDKPRKLFLLLRHCVVLHNR